jgi:alcohol dehydrogenase class IV
MKIKSKKYVKKEKRNIMKKSQKRKLKKRKQKKVKQPKIVTTKILNKPTLLEQIKKRFKQFAEDHFIIFSFLDTLVYMVLIYGSIALLYFRTN